MSSTVSSSVFQENRRTFGLLQRIRVLLSIPDATRNDGYAHLARTRSAQTQTLTCSRSSFKFQHEASNSLVNPRPRTYPCQLDAPSEDGIVEATVVAMRDIRECETQASSGIPSPPMSMLSFWLMSTCYCPCTHFPQHCA